MNWQGINEFVAVAEAQSFSAAARHLSISTAQVSRQITALEKRLQVKLFYRTTRRVSLTQEAQQFYHHCRHVLDELDSAEQAITHLQDTPTGHIKLTAPMSYGEHKVIPLINDFVGSYNGIQITTELINHQVDLIEGGFDLAIRIGTLQDSTLMAKRLTQRKVYVCATPEYLQQHGEPQTLADLGAHNCLLGTKDHWRFSHNGKLTNIRVSGNLHCNSALGLLDAALKHIGLVQLSDFYLQAHLRSGALIPVLRPWQMPAEEVWAIYPQNRYLSPKIRLLIDYLAAHL